MEEAKEETKVEEEKLWACFADPKRPDDGPWYILTKWEVIALADPPSPMTLTDATTLKSKLPYVKVIRHPKHPFDRTVFEAILRTEMASPPAEVKQESWTRWLLCLFEMTTTTDEPEFKDPGLFKQAINAVRENPDVLNWAALFAA